jgi:hypothetical protein
MPRFVCLAVLALAGCPPAPRYAVVDVVDPEPVNDALVAADCGKIYGAAARTDDTGRARLEIHPDADPRRCTVTVAKPGYPTVATLLYALCSTVTACPPTLVQLVELEPVPTPTSRAYAQPPGGLR